MEKLIKYIICSLIMCFCTVIGVYAVVVPTPAISQEQIKPLPAAQKIQTNESLNKEIEKDTESKIEKIQEAKLTQDKIDALSELRDQAKLLYNSNKLAQAQEIFNKIPDSEKISDDWLFLANIAQDNGKAVDAVFYLKKSIMVDDKNYKAHYNLGNIYLSDNKVNMALDEYRKVLRIKKDYSYAYYNKGCCYLKKKSWYNARYEFGLAIKANPEEPAFYYNLAYTYKMMKKPKKAQEALDIYNKLMTE